jgi:hypothetical protein
MKKFSSITDKNTSIDFKKKKQSDVSNDIESLDNQIEKEIEGTKLDGSWEIVSIIDVSTEMPDVNESKALIINAEVGNREIKRGEHIYITAQIKRPGQTQAYHHNQMGVIKVRVVDIYNTMMILNSIR